MNTYLNTFTNINTQVTNNQSITNNATPTAIDAQNVKIRDIALEIIRNNMPISSLFTPELKIDLNVFIKDQMLFQQIAAFLETLTERNLIDSATVEKHFENSELLIEIKVMFKLDPTPFLTLFYQACADVLNNKSSAHDLKPAIAGRIYTFKNALVAQHTPEAIRQSQRQNQIALQSTSNIIREGESFLHECLRLHLYAPKRDEETTFKELIAATAEQLVPFVQQITRSYLKENGYICPDDPLAFRNPNGYNHHGLVAATVMEACLNALGYTTRIMGRCDLEPKVTLATVHNVVVVTAPDQSRYIIDPTYIQFHKDICIEDTQLPKSPVLVLAENEVDRYVEENFMVLWRATNRLVKNNDRSTIKKLSDRDQILSHIIDTLKLPPDIIPSNPEEWTKKSLTRIWDIKSHTPILSDEGFQEIFVGNAQAHKTHDYIKAMGIASLTNHLSIEEVEKRLTSLLETPDLKGKNFPDALSLITQLPTVYREKYASFLHFDSRIKGISSFLNAYFSSVKKCVNPDGKDKSVVYGCAGADCKTVMLATDATDYTFVDLTPVNYNEFTRALTQFQNSTPTFEKHLEQLLEESQNFISRRQRNGGASSSCLNGKHNMDLLASKLLFDLREVGVDLKKVVLTQVKNETGVKLEFPWQYLGAPSPKTRTLTFLTGDITTPSTYPTLLKNKLKDGIDLFYMKASFLAPTFYPQFIPQIAKSINKDGWLMTTDKTFTMETMTPDHCLQENNLTFESRKSNEIQILEEIVAPPYAPLNSIPVLSYLPAEKRYARTVGSDLSYWSILSLRQKK